jgi:hypothetical protein
MLAAKDFDLYGPNDKFGATLTFDNDIHSKQYEPGAELPGDRIAALKEAHGWNPYLGFNGACHLSCSESASHRNDLRVRGFLLDR